VDDHTLPAVGFRKTMQVRSPKRKRHRRLLVLGVVAVVVLSQLLAFILTIMSAAPAVDSEYEALQRTVIHARDGEVLAGIYREDRSYLPIEEIPALVREAFIAVEDRNFYRHHGVDPIGIMRALYANLRHREIVEGGSTITQQLARNLHLDRSRTIRRKLMEIRIALELERRYTKDEILELYLNHIYLGAGAYGVQAASNRYFDRDVDELSLDQVAMLAALPRAPHYYSPIDNHDAAKGRRNLVLQRMNQNDYISEAEADAAAAQPLRTTDPEHKRETGAPGFVEFVRRELLEPFDTDAVYGEGLMVYTTLDIPTQVQAEKALEDAFESGLIPSRTVEGDLQPQAALVTIDAHTGAIRSMIGGRGDDEFNRAVQARRHPGSAFKPFIYAAAISRGRHPGTVVNDLPRVFREEGDESIVWPRNFDDTYRGPVSYRTALARSINTAAVEVIKDIGVDTVRSHLDRYGFTSLTERDGQPGHYALALGGLDHGVTPLEMATAYAAFAAAGTAPQSFAITRVTNRDGDVLYRADPETSTDDHQPAAHYARRAGPAPLYTEKLPPEPALTAAEAYVMTDMLRTVVEEGTGTGARLDVPAAGKTGTSDANHDAWFIGYTGELVSAVWIGEDAPRAMRYRRTADQSIERDDEDYDIELTGVHASLIWGDYMRRRLDAQEPLDPDPAFERPEGIHTIQVDPITGDTPEIHSPRRVREIAVDEHRPRVAWPPVLFLPLVTPLAARPQSDETQVPRHLWSTIATVEVDALTGLPVQIMDDQSPSEGGPMLTLEREFLSGSGILLGPTMIALGNREGLVTKGGEPFHGVYQVDRREPVQKIDPSTGMPVNPDEPQFLRVPLLLESPPPAGARSR
ncbi:MAG: PBP1A family penicillin-binding protein, partial [Spirochaetaceae bacterium]